jgi:curved DNA-binding protein
MDPYKILGVNKTASQNEIKKAYRKLSLQYHPDKNPEGAEKFKEIASAYELIDTEEKRQKYEKRGFKHFDFGEFEWNDSNVDFSNMFDQRFGSGFRPKRKVNVQITISLRESYYGLRRTVQLVDDTVGCNIPAGCKTGTSILLKSTSIEEIYAVINVAPDSEFTRVGNDLQTQIKVDIFDLMLGTEASVKVFDSTYRFVLKSGTQPGTILRLKNKGMPIMNFPDHKGNLFVELIAQIPNSLTDDELTAVRELKEKITNK